MSEICERCGKEAEELFETTEGEMLCEECIEDGGYEQCDLCELYSDDCIEDFDGRYCRDCLENRGPATLEYADCRFAMEVVNGDLINLDRDLQREMLDRILEKEGITEEQLADILIEERLDDLKKDSVLREIGDYDMIAEIFGCNNLGNEFNCKGLNDCEELGWVVQDLLKSLGYELERLVYDGPHGHDTHGVIIIR